jgi:hypothetical protein
MSKEQYATLQFADNDKHIDGRYYLASEAHKDARAIADDLKRPVTVWERRPNCVDGLYYSNPVKTYQPQ